MLVIHFLCSKDNHIVCFVLLSCTYNQLKLAAEELTLPSYLTLLAASYKVLPGSTQPCYGFSTWSLYAQTLDTTEEFFL